VGEDRLAVLDEACVEHRTEMCLRLEDAGRSTAVEASLEQRCTSLACELPKLRMEQYPGEWKWPTTPWDLMTCLQFARFDPGGGECRKPVPVTHP
jgi:hypothetical protein